jgi:hypothetical protein
VLTLRLSASDGEEDVRLICETGPALEHGSELLEAPPTTIQFSGTTASSGRSIRKCTTPWMRTAARVLMHTPLNTAAPVATNTLSPTVQQSNSREGRRV